MQDAYQIEVCRWDAHELLDSGNGRKLERFGDQILIRPEPKAWWRPQSAELWNGALAEVTGKGTWRFTRKAESKTRSWWLDYQGIKLEARLTEMSKHVGVFPEQQPHWRWISEKLKGVANPSVLNLFGYTGVASLVAAAAGADVVHVDASKPSLNWARSNQSASGMDDTPVRWLLDDAFKFVAREIRRGRRYHAILLDPPSFGRGPRGEIWKVEQQIVDFLNSLRQILNPEGSMMVLTMYNLDASALMLANLVADCLPSGQLEFGELCLQESAGKRLLPLSLFCRWNQI
jgi:23S rRNA (cytosine1962-C5)-methyltransferase